MSCTRVYLPSDLVKDKLPFPQPHSDLGLAEYTLPVDMTHLKDERKTHLLPDIPEGTEADWPALRHGIVESV